MAVTKSDILQSGGQSCPIAFLPHPIEPQPQTSNRALDSNVMPQQQQFRSTSLVLTLRTSCHVFDRDLVLLVGRVAVVACTLGGKKGIRSGTRPSVVCAQHSCSQRSSSSWARCSNIVGARFEFHVELHKRRLQTVWLLGVRMFIDKATSTSFTVYSKTALRSR